jgi:ubiquinone/menaquinone biosynthesis C-methylase UbiE
VGAGTGIWSIELARVFPESLVLGLDVDTALFTRTPPANCLLRAGNVLNGLPLPDAVADFVHQRFLVLAIPDARWPGVVRELVRVTQLGGWIELVETDARVRAGGPATEQMMTWMDMLRQARGLMGEKVAHLREMLQREGIQDVEAQTIQLQVGAWGGRAGVMMERDILAAVQALKEPCCAHGVAVSTFDACVQAMALEWQQAHAFCLVYVAYGRRRA